MANIGQYEFEAKIGDRIALQQAAEELIAGECRQPRSAEQLRRGQELRPRRGRPRDAVGYDRVELDETDADAVELARARPAFRQAHATPFCGAGRSAR